MARRAVAILLFMVLPIAVAGQSLTFPPGTETDAEVEDVASDHVLPVGPFRNGEAELRAFAGTRTDEVSRISPAQSVDALTDSLVAQLSDMTVLYDCRTNICGGFDFRFTLNVLPEPEMHVDLTDFRYVIAVNSTGDRAMAFVVSRSALSSFVQVTEITPDVPSPEDIAIIDAPEGPLLPDLPIAEPEVPEIPITVPGTFAQSLEETGHAVLENLDFPSGAAELGEGQFPALQELADWMEAHPAAMVAIVGHTDAVGGLDANVRLSQRRAQSVVDRLVASYGVPKQQIEALGAGYMSPRATNQTEDGRQLNRRVEAVVTAPY